MKSKIENDIIDKSANALSTNVACAGKTIVSIAKDSMISRGHFDELRLGKKRINIVHLVKIANAIKRYPSELLPLEWQKPAEINEEILGKAVSEILKNKESLDLSSISNLIIQEYKNILRDKF